jgi:hypothetical protein
MASYHTLLTILQSIPLTRINFEISFYSREIHPTDRSCSCTRLADVLIMAYETDGSNWFPIQTEDIQDEESLRSAMTFCCFSYLPPSSNITSQDFLHQVHVEQLLPRKLVLYAAVMHPQYPRLIDPIDQTLIPKPQAEYEEDVTHPFYDLYHNMRKEAIQIGVHEGCFGRHHFDGLTHDPNDSLFFQIQHVKLSSMYEIRSRVELLQAAGKQYELHRPIGTKQTAGKLPTVNAPSLLSLPRLLSIGGSSCCDYPLEKTVL